MALAPSLPPAAPAAWLAAIATGKSCWFCKIWFEIPCSVCAVVTPTGEVSLCTRDDCADVLRASLTSSGCVLATLSVSLLNSKAASKGTCDCSVAASYSADVTSGSANAVEVVRHRNVDCEVLLFGLRKSIGTGHVVGNLQWRELGGSVTGLVKVALVRAGTISINLHSLATVCIS